MRHLLFLLLLAGCATPPPPALVTRIVTITPSIPAGLLTCAPAPAVPLATSQAAVAKYIVALWQAGQDCRVHIMAISHVTKQ
jgi:hypothetical protein